MLIKNGTITFARRRTIYIKTNGSKRVKGFKKGRKLKITQVLQKTEFYFEIAQKQLPADALVYTGKYQRRKPTK